MGYNFTYCNRTCLILNGLHLIIIGVSTEVNVVVLVVVGVFSHSTAILSGLYRPHQHNIGQLILLAHQQVTGTLIPKMIIFPLGPRQPLRVVTFCSKLTVLILLCALDVDRQHVEFEVGALSDIDAHLIPNRRVVANITISML